MSITGGTRFSNGGIWATYNAQGVRGVPYWLAYHATESPARNAVFWSANNVRIDGEFSTLEAAMMAAEKAINGS